MTEYKPRIIFSIWNLGINFLIEVFDIVKKCIETYICWSIMIELNWIFFCILVSHFLQFSLLNVTIFWIIDYSILMNFLLNFIHEKEHPTCQYLNLLIFFKKMIIVSIVLFLFEQKYMLIYQPTVVEKVHALLEWDCWRKYLRNI